MWCGFAGGPQNAFWMCQSIQLRVRGRLVESHRITPAAGIAGVINNVVVDGHLSWGECLFGVMSFVWFSQQMFVHCFCRFVCLCFQEHFSLFGCSWFEIAHTSKPSMVALWIVPFARWMQCQVHLVVMPVVQWTCQIEG